VIASTRPQPLVAGSIGIQPPANRCRVLVDLIGPHANVRWGRIKSPDACACRLTAAAPRRRRALPSGAATPPGGVGFLDRIDGVDSIDRIDGGRNGHCWRPANASVTRSQPATAPSCTLIGIKPPAIRHRRLVESIGLQINVRWGLIKSPDACACRLTDCSHRQFLCRPPG